MTSFLSQEETSNMGFSFVGDNVKISKNAHFYGSNFISIGSNSRIDDFCIISASSEGAIVIGNHVHISAGVFLFGSAGIEIDDFAGLSSGVKIYSASDDYSGEFLTNPTVDIEFLNLKKGKVLLGRHSIIGSNTVVFPGVKITEGTAVGALSLITKTLEPSWGIYVGQPAKRIKERSKRILELENHFLSKQYQYEEPSSRPSTPLT